VKCSRCGSRAVIYLRYAKLALCRDHLESYLARKVSSVVRDAVPRSSLVLVAVSGGKDSASAASLLKLLENELATRVLLVHLNLGIQGYSEECCRAAEALAEKLERPLILVGLEQALGLSVDKAAKLAKRPVCSVCGLVKRYTLNLAANLAGASRLATGHNLDDIAAYAVKAFLVGGEGELAKLVGHSETKDGLVGRLRPLLEVSEREALVYALTSGLPFHHEECPYVNREGLEFKAKEFLNTLEAERPGFKLSFLRRLREKLSTHVEGEVKKCSVCDMPTSTDVCAFCRLIYRATGSYEGVEAFKRSVEGAVRKALTKEY